MIKTFRFLSGRAAAGIKIANIDSLLTLVIPVMIARSRYGFVLKCGIEQIAHKFHCFIPVAMHISLLHGRVILIQQNNDLFAIIAQQITGQGIKGPAAR